MSARMAFKIMVMLLSVSMLVLALKGNGVSVKAEGEVATIRVLNPETNDSFFILKASEYPIGSVFTAVFSITHVEKLVAWEISVSWNNSIVNFQNVSIPDGNVFASAIDGATLITSASSDVVDDTGYLKVNATLLPETPVDVTNQGVLCQVNFTIQQLPSDEVLCTEITFVQQETFVVLELGQKPVFTTSAYLCILNFSPIPDINDDGVIKFDDVMAVVDAFGSYPTHLRWNPHVDLDLNGRITMADIVVILMNFGKTYP
ncbi:MAG: hypothetical protein QXN36_02460 [Candidatus Bathyarchaeia archaeon]